MTWESDCVDRYWQSIRGTWQRRYFNRYYRSIPGWIDGTTRFWSLIKKAAPPNAHVLEIGAGPTNPTTEFLRTLGEVHGVDVDPVVKSNAYLSMAELIADQHFPMADATYDLCISNFVVEHVKEPVTHLSEVKRVLKPGGAYVFRTPNRWHYVSLIAQCTPHWFHDLVTNATRNLPTETHGPYPTVYAMNSRRVVRRLARDAGFDVVTMEMVEADPSYGMRSRALYLAFLAYERLVNASEHLAPIRADIFVQLRKPVGT